jgi:hypothetical protein
MTGQAELFGPVASVPTVWRTLDEIATRGGRVQARITGAVKCGPAACMGGHRGPPRCPARGAGRGQDATIVACHSSAKVGAEPNFKGFGLPPLGCWCDNTGEPPAGMLRPGSASSNTTADHLTVLEPAIAALPAKCRRRLMVTSDGAGASHGLISRLDQLASAPGTSSFTCP